VCECGGEEGERAKCESDLWLQCLGYEYNVKSDE
jgi:hypothetical protein